MGGHSPVVTVDPEPQVIVAADADVQGPVRPVGADTPADSGVMSALVPPTGTPLRRFKTEPVIRCSPVALGSSGKSSQLSLGASVLSIKNQLKRADEARDADEMQIALRAARPVIELLAERRDEVVGTGLGQVPKQEAWQLTKLYDDMKGKLAKDSRLKFKAKLRTSERILGRVRRLWDLAVSESRIMAEENGTEAMGEREVSREGYRELHMRVALSVTNGRRKKGEDQDQLQKRLLAQVRPALSLVLRPPSHAPIDTGHVDCGA